MTNLITAQEAFNALQNGKEVLCSKLFEDDFKSLENYPATIFAMPGYEFCIKVELMELAGFKFAKPLTPHDVKDEQEIFIVMPMRILRTKFDAENSEILCSVMHGFAQADAENAELQLKAIGATFGHVIDEVEVKDGFNEKLKRQRSKKESQVKAEKPVKIEKTSEVIAETKQPSIVITEQTNVTTSEDLLIQPSDDSAIKPNSNAQFEILIDAIRICNSEKELDSTCANLEKEGFSPEQIKSINEAKQNRLTELDAKEIDAAVPIEMPANYKSLKQSICDATTPEAVNAVMNYTGKWTEEQRNVLVLEVHKKLAELDQGKKKENEPSYLLVKIQAAPDFESLDALVIEVSKRDEFIQPKLMGAVKKRRFELETSKTAITEKAEPDYLLVDGF